MRDPHVEWLVYEMKHDGTVKYHEPPAVVASRDQFWLRLSDDTLLAYMLEHFGEVADARDYVEPFLRAWERTAYLRNGRRHLEFEFLESHVYERDSPDPGEAQVIRAPFTSAGGKIFPPKYIQGRKEYPEPPNYETFSPDAETLASRYQGYRDGNEPLLAMAYFCLTVVEGRLGGRRIAAKKYNIDIQVLNKLGELTSTRGDETEARKYSAQARELSSAERKWIDLAIREIGLQVAAIDGGANPRILSLADLPSM